METGSINAMNKTIYGNITNGSTGGISMTSVITAIAESVFILLITFGNVLVVVAFGKFKHLQTKCNIFVVNLSCADLLVALVGLPIQIMFIIWPELQNIFVLCIFRYTTFLLTTGSSVMFLLCIAIERGIAIVYPLQHRTIVTSTRVKIISVSVWLYTSILGVLPLFGWNDWYGGIECSYLTVMSPIYLVILSGQPILIGIIVSVIYAKIFIIAYRHFNQKLSRDSSIKSTTTLVLAKNIKMAKTFCLVVGIFSFCFLPLSVVTFIELVPTISNDAAMVLPDAVITAAFILAVLNSCMNPLVYGFRLKPFSSAFRKLLCCSSKTNDSRNLSRSTTGSTNISLTM